MAGVSTGGTGTNYGGDLRRGPDYAGSTPSTTWTVSAPVHGPVGSQEAGAIVGRGQARIADPIPLGLAGFAAATFTASTVLAGWFSMNDLLVGVIGGYAGIVASLLAAHKTCRAGEVQRVHMGDNRSTCGNSRRRWNGVICLLHGLMVVYSRPQNKR